MQSSKINLKKTGVEEIEKYKKVVEEYKNKYLRALADYQNSEKRFKEERSEIGKAANGILILQLLPFLDDLDKAEIFIKDPGLKMVKDKFHALLNNLGLEEIDVLGKEFDPHTSEAVDVVEGERDNIVAEALRRGYKYNGKVLRVAQVKVSKKKLKI